MTDVERKEKVGEHGVIYIIGKPIARGVLRGKFDRKDVIVKRVELFENCDIKELDYLRSFSHENVVKYLYNDVDFQFLYIVLEKCDCTLAEFVRDKKHDLRHLDVLWQISKGMVYLHEKKDLVHRDLNPSNVLMIFQDHRWVAKITDFDISKKMPFDRTRVTQSGIRGTGSYMAPEQMTGCKIGKSVDIYSCGLVFHYVLSEGKHPFGSNIFEAERKMLAEDATPDLNSIKNEYKYDAESLIRAMISRKQENRVRIKDVQAHHIFWNPKKTLLFYQDVSDYIIKPAERYEEMKLILNVGGIADDWRQSIRTDFPIVGAVLDKMKHKKQGDEICDLLRNIRNLAHHYGEKEAEFQEAIGSLPDGFYEFFKNLFPKLLNHIYESMKPYNGEAIFLNYYTYKEQEHLEQKPLRDDTEPSETEKANSYGKRKSNDSSNSEQPDRKKSKDCSELPIPEDDIVSTPSANTGSGESVTVSVEKCIQSLVHACQCRNANCNVPACIKMKKAVHHAKNCKKKSDGSCLICKQLIALCYYHAKNCQETKCAVFLCHKIKEKLQEREQRQMAVIPWPEYGQELEFQDHSFGSRPSTEGPPMSYPDQHRHGNHHNLAHRTTSNDSSHQRQQQSRGLPIDTSTVSINAAPIGNDAGHGQAIVPEPVSPHAPSQMLPQLDYTPGKHELMVSVRYRGTTVMTQHVTNAHGCRIHYGNSGLQHIATVVHELPNHVFGSPDLQQIELVDVEPWTTFQKQIILTNYLLKNIQRGLILTVQSDGTIIAKRLCQAKVYFMGPESTQYEPETL